MNTWSMPTNIERKKSSLSTMKAKTVLVFSPDADLAKSLSLLLEERFTVVCETKLENLRQRIDTSAPAVLVIDLFAFPSDIVKETEIVRGGRKKIPVVLLRIHRLLNPDVEEAIGNVADVVLYKPLDGNSVDDAIQRLLKTR